jgi:hypothetical protein
MLGAWCDARMSDRGSILARMTRPLGHCTNAQATLLSATLLCVSVVLAACGGSDSSAGTSRSAFVSGATRVCTAYYNKAYALPPPIGVAQLLALPEKQQRLREQELSGLRAVTPPPASRAAYTTYLGDMAALDSFYGSLLAKFQTTRSLKAFNALHLKNLQTLDKREQRNQISREAKALRELRTPPPSSVHTSEEKVLKLEATLDRQAHGLGLTECAKEPYSAERSD